MSHCVRYERYEKNQVQAKHGAIRKGPPVALPLSQGATGGGQQSKSLMDAPLIDFSVSEPPASQVPSLANFQVKKDTFARSGSNFVLKDDDAHNLAEWIGEKNIDTDGATTQEFDQFLAERAAATDTPRKEK